MYGIRAPGALSFIPLPKFMRHTARNLHRFLCGSHTLGTTWTDSGAGELGRLLSRSAVSTGVVTLDVLE